MQKSIGININTTNNLLYDPLKYKLNSDTFDAVFEVTSTGQKLLLLPSQFKDIYSAGHMLNIIASCNEGINYNTGDKGGIINVGYVMPKINNKMNLFYPAMQSKLISYAPIKLETYDGSQASIFSNQRMKMTKILQGLMYRNLLYSFNDYTIDFNFTLTPDINYDELVTPVTLSNDILEFNNNFEKILGRTGTSLISNSLIQQIITFLDDTSYTLLEGYINFLNINAPTIAFDFIEFFYTIKRPLYLIVNIVHTLNYHGNLSSLTQQSLMNRKSELVDIPIEPAFNITLNTESFNPKLITDNDIQNILNLRMDILMNYLNFFENKAKGRILYGERTETLFGDFYFIADENESNVFDISDEIMDMIRYNVDFFNQRILKIILIRKKNVYPLRFSLGKNIQYCLSQRYFVLSMNNRRNNELLSLAFQRVFDLHGVYPQKNNIEELLCSLPITVSTPTDTRDFATYTFV